MSKQFSARILEKNRVRALRNALTTRPEASSCRGVRTTNAGIRSYAFIDTRVGLHTSARTNADATTKQSSSSAFRPFNETLLSFASQSSEYDDLQEQLAEGNGLGAKAAQLRGALSRPHSSSLPIYSSDPEYQVPARSSEWAGFNSLDTKNSFEHSLQGQSSPPEQQNFFLELQHLLNKQPITSDQILEFLGRSAWWRGSGQPRILAEKEHQLLREALQRIVLFDFDRNITPANNVASSIYVLQGFQNRGLLGQSDWAVLLRTSSLAVLQHVFKQAGQSHRQAVWEWYTTTIKLQWLFELWEFFFKSHQIYNGSTRKSSELWEWLSEVSGHDVSSGSGDFAERLLAFAPIWQKGQDGVADREIGFASLLSLSALSKSLANLGNLQCPLGTGTNEHGSSASPSKPWSTLLSHDLTVDEHSFLHVILCALQGSARLNQTLLRLSFARLSLKESEARDLLSCFNRLHNDAQGLLEGISSNGQRLKSFKDGKIVDSAMTRVTESLVRATKRSTTAEHLDFIFDTCTAGMSCLTEEQRHMLAHAICRRYLLLGHFQRGLTMWEASPELRQLKDLSRLLLSRYFKEDKVAAFESIWYQRPSGPVSPGLLQASNILFFRNSQGERAFRWFTRIVQLSRANTVLQAPEEHLTWEVEKVTLPLFNTMLRLCCENKMEPQARYVYELLQNQHGLQPNGMTYRYMFHLELNHGSIEAASFWLRKACKSVDSELHLKVLKRDVGLLLTHNLMLGTTSTSWAKVGPVFYKINQALIWCFLLLHKSGSLLQYKSPDAVESRYLLPASPDALIKYLQNPKDETNKTGLDGVPAARAAWGCELTSIYLGFFESIVENVSNVSHQPLRKLRMVLVLTEHFDQIFRRPLQWSGHRDFWPPFIKPFQDAVLAYLMSATEEEQLLLLDGYLYHAGRRSPGNYQNFKFVNKIFGPAYLATRLQGVELQNRVEIVEAFNRNGWQGFQDSHDTQLFMKACIESPTIRSQMIEDQKQLKDKANAYSKALTGKLALNSRFTVGAKPFQRRFEVRPTRKHDDDEDDDGVEGSEGPVRRLVANLKK